MESLPFFPAKCPERDSTRGGVDRMTGEILLQKLLFVELFVAILL